MTNDPAHPSMGRHRRRNREVFTGKKQGRRSEDEITLFDSTGIAFQDSATVPLEYERAVAAGVGIEKDDFHLTA
jgi:ornithine cyclodeaminase/alanine dehydrogenase-like protein (mu-crystallin family)